MFIRYIEHVKSLPDKQMDRKHKYEPFSFKCIGHSEVVQQVCEHYIIFTVFSSGTNEFILLSFKILFFGQIASAGDTSKVTFILI